MNYEYINVSNHAIAQFCRRTPAGKKLIQAMEEACMGEGKELFIADPHQYTVQLARHGGGTKFYERNGMVHVVQNNTLITVYPKTQCSHDLRSQEDIADHIKPHVGLA